MSRIPGGLRPRDRRAIMLGLIVLVPAAVLVLVVRPYLDVLSKTRDQLAAERALLAREQALLRAANVFGDQQVLLDTALEQRSARLLAGDPTVATGQLARYLAAAAESSRVLIEASETAGSTEVVPGLEAVRLRFRAVSDVAGVMDLVRGLEDGDRLVRIEALTLERRDRGVPAQGTDTGDAVQRVTLAAMIEGYTIAPRSGSMEQ